jgi:predicted MFS family arabinose efflux permease
MGVGAATLSILGAQVISENFTGTQYLGAAMGTMNTAVPMGILISQLSFSRLAAARGWQAPVWVCFAFTAVTSVAYLLFYRDPALVEGGHVSLAAGLRHLSPEVWKLGVVWMFWNAGAMVLLTFANDLLVGRGMSTQTAGMMASVLMVFPIGASSVMGHILDRRSSQGRGAVIGCVLFAMFVILLGVLKGSVVPLFLGVSFTFALAPAAVFALAPYLMHGRESGLGYGVLAGLLNVGVLFGPAIGGVVRDATGSYLASFIMAGVLTCLGAGCVAFLHRPRTQDAR